MDARTDGPSPPPTPVVLLHGQPGGARDWELVLPHLDGLRVLVPDRPGYDGTPARGYADNARAVLRLLDRHHVERAVLAGYSWGGGVALATALLAPDRVAALALVASVGTRSSYDVIDRLLATRVAGAVTEVVMRRLGPRLAGPLTRAMGSRLDADRLAIVREGFEVARSGPVWRSYRVEQRALIRETGRLDAALAEVAPPAVVLVGTRDRAVRPNAGRELARRLPVSVLREVDGGHLLPFEAPGAVAAAIREAVRWGACGLG